MERIVKYLWIVMIVFTIFGLLALIPIGKIQRAYLSDLNRIKHKPQKRVNATMRYVDAVEMGVEDASKGILTNPPAKYYKKVVILRHKTNNGEYRHPLYIRDKHNPHILYRVRKH